MECAPLTMGLRSCGASLAVAVLTVVLVACSQGFPLFQGSAGSSESTPFELEDGSYLLAWTTSAQTPAGCQIAVELVTDGETVAARAEGGTTSGGASQDSQPVPEVTAGSYRLRVDSTCESWTAVVGEDPAGRE